MEMNMTGKNTELELEELQTRLVYAFLQASAGLSSVFGFGLKTFERLSHMAAFHVLRKKSLDLNQIALYLVAVEKWTCYLGC